MNDIQHAATRKWVREHRLRKGSPMRFVWLITVTDVQTDANWRWVFALLPSIEAIEKQVNMFIEKWKGNPEVEPYYPNWPRIDWDAVKPLDTHPRIDEQGKSLHAKDVPENERAPSKHIAYLRVTKIEMVG